MRVNNWYKPFEFTGDRWNKNDETSWLNQRGRVELWRCFFFSFSCDSARFGPSKLLFLGCHGTELESEDRFAEDGWNNSRKFIFSCSKSFGFARPKWSVVICGQSWWMRFHACHQCSGDAIQGMNEANFGAPKVDAWIIQKVTRHGWFSEIILQLNKTI